MFKKFIEKKKWERFKLKLLKEEMDRTDLTAYELELGSGEGGIIKELLVEHTKKLLTDEEE